MKKQVFITIEGGQIQNINVSADLEDMEVTVIDFDVDGIASSELTYVKNQFANVRQYDVSAIGDGDVAFFERLAMEAEK